MKIRSELPTTKEFEKDVKLDVKGDYVAVVSDTRLVNDARYGEGFFIDYVVETAPAGGERYVGKASSWGKFPENAKGGSNQKTGKTLSAKQAREKDEIAVQKACASVYGLSADEAGALTQEQFDAAFNAEAERGTSPLKGKRITIRVKSYGEGKFFSEVHPLAGAPAVAPELPRSLPTLSPPSRPGKPAAKPSFDIARAAAGFEVHPNDASFVYNETTEEVISVDELKTRLGY